MIQKPLLRESASIPGSLAQKKGGCLLHDTVECNQSGPIVVTSVSEAREDLVTIYCYQLTVDQITCRRYLQYNSVLLSVMRAAENPRRTARLPVLPRTL